jgi:hypothetical protein
MIESTVAEASGQLTSLQRLLESAGHGAPIHDPDR